MAAPARWNRSAGVPAGCREGTLPSLLASNTIRRNEIEEQYRRAACESPARECRLSLERRRQSLRERYTHRALNYGCPSQPGRAALQGRV